MIFESVDFSKLTFSKNISRNTIRVSNGLGADQDQCSVGPDLAPNCLKSYQQTTSRCQQGKT